MASQSIELLCSPQVTYSYKGSTKLEKLKTSEKTQSIKTNEDLTPAPTTVKRKVCKVQFHMEFFEIYAVVP